MNYIFEMMAMLGTYFILFFAIPLMMWKQYLKDKSYTYRFVFVSVVQTFIVINLITYLQLLYICNIYTVTLSYIVLFYFVRYFKRWYILGEMIRSFGKNLQKLIFSTMGFKTFLGIYLKNAWNMMKGAWIPVLKMVRTHWLEVVAILLIMGYALWYYAYGVMHYNHYGFGDFTVHHSWTIDMKNGIIFSDGVYPMGMHCMLYFLDMFSFFPLRNANLYLGLFQTMVMFLILYALVRSLSRSRYLPLLSILIMACLHVFDKIPLARLQWSLPQEVGIYSVLACVYFLYRYLHTEIEKPACKWYAIRPYMTKKYLLQSDLMLFGMSVALTISIHFYDTILAFVFCIAIAIMYSYRVFMKRYLFPLFLICMSALCISCIPFGVGIMQGKGIQASLTWATDVMKNEDVDGVVSTNTSISDDEKKSENTTDETETAPVEKSLKDKLVILNKSLDQMIFSKPWSDIYRIASMLCILNAFIYLCRRNVLMFSKYISLPLQGFLLVLLYDLALLDLPMLVAQIRVYVFIILQFSMVCACAFDIFYHLTFKNNVRILLASLESLSFIQVGGAAYMIFDQGWDDKKLYQEFTIYNEAIDCTDRIVRDFPNFTWTVISTINELTTTKEDGYHYELWELLRDVEKQKSLYIPTEKVFIYVEKKPMEYADYVYFDDLEIKQYELSEEAAKRDIPLENQTDDIYKGRDRVAIFSKTYVWAMKMKDMYPNEFKIYYDSDNFICFELTQNPYHLIDLSIPIDYSDRKVWAAYD